jgi:FixJ family two-component response regulator
MNLTQILPTRSATLVLEAPVVHIVDNDATTRDALGLIVRRAGWRSASAISAEEFLRCPRTMTAGCLLVDFHLAGMSSLSLQRTMLDRGEMPVIFMATHADLSSTVQAMKAGAFEFLTKPLDEAELVDAISRAIENSRAALRQLTLEQTLQSRYESLTRREREVLRLLVAGRLNKQVGGELGISEITVKAHRGKVMQKMKARSFAELVIMAYNLFCSPGYRLSNYLDRGINATLC